MADQYPLSAAEGGAVSGARLSDVGALMQLYEFGTRCLRTGEDLDGCLDAALETAIRLTAANKAMLQLVDRDTAALVVRAQRGFNGPLLDYFSQVHGRVAAACIPAPGRAVSVMVEDVTRSELFAGERSADVLLAQGVRALQCTPLVGSTGRVLGMLSTHFIRPTRLPGRDLRLLDLLARQAAFYVERKQTEGQLLHDIGERKRLEEHLRIADRKKDEFLAMLAHELRNALAPIRYALAASEKSGRTPEQLARAECVIERQVAHMVRLVDDLLEVSRITRDKMSLEKSATDLAAILGCAAEAARPMLEAKRHTLSIDLPQEPVTMDADPVRLAQVFSNLLINAAKYTDPGGRIELRTRQEGGEVAISVRDNGIGISAELLPRLFTLFAQSPGEASSSEGGLGIGLALVRGIVELHGGRVEAKSAGPHQGSEFIVRLPLGTVTLRPKDIAADSRTSSAARLKILLADDNRDAVDTCAALLELSGHYVQIAYTGRAALALADRFRPQALILDIGLPDIDGYVLAEQIRRTDWGRSAVLVAVTGFGRDEDRTRAFAAGFDHHLTKPVTGAALEMLLEAGSVASTAVGQRETSHPPA